jgi:two-component system response regulator MprA
LRVIVVDDQPAVCEVVADCINYAGHEVVARARDGVEAVACAEKHRPDLVVMDVVMPRMDGVAAMEAILKAGTARWVVIMSGEYRSRGYTTASMLERGATAFLEKPFDVSQLFSLLDKLQTQVGQS